ncbi:MAG: autotransporter outer membrane beta-barrel domain-containing protein [Myxococcota bacterium]|nr:autotransporter outer membrane beta-barrel domain-containing protein [Myxococcota bacterium]
MRSSQLRRVRTTLRKSLGVAVGALLFSSAALAGMGMGNIDSANLLRDVEGANGLQQASGVFLGSTCDGLAELGVNKDGRGATEDLFRECTRVVGAALDIEGGFDNIDGFDNDDVLDSLFAVAHEESTAQARLALGVAAASLGRIHDRMVAIRQGSTGIQIAGLRLRDSEGNQLVGEDVAQALNAHAANGGGGGLFDDEKLGVFLNGLGAWGDYDGNDVEIDYDTRSWGLIGGADYRITNELAAGVALGFSRTDDDFARDAGTLKSDSWSGSAFATYSRDAWFVDGIFTLTGVDYELRRELRYPTLRRTADGDTDGFLIAAAAGAGYDFVIGSLTIGPRARMEYVDTEISSFEERKAGGLNLAFDSQNIQSFVTDLGVDASYAISTSRGIIAPYARAEWEHEYLDSSRVITARFVADPNRNRFRLRTQSPDRNVVNIGAGVAVTMPGGYSAFVDFDTILFSKLWELYTVTVGARIAF